MENNAIARKPLKTIGNRKRQRSSPNAANANDDPMKNIEPPHKRQKVSSKRSSKSKSRRSSKTKPRNSEAKDEETELDKDHFLNGITSTSVTINRLHDPVRFDDDEDDDYMDNKSRKLKFNIFSTNKIDNKNYIPLADFFRAFKYSSSSVPKPKEIRKSFIEHIKSNINQQYELSQDELITKFRGKPYVSEAGFCILIRFLAGIDGGNKYLQHFRYFRYYYRKQLFCKSLSIPRIKQPHPIDEGRLCPACCLDDIETNFYFDNPCDCEVPLHLNCTKLKVTQECIPAPAADAGDDDNDTDFVGDWFCPFCTNYASLDTLKERRNQQKEADWGYEVEAIIDYRYSDNNYLVKWKGYPNAANIWNELSKSFVEIVEQYWKDRKSAIPHKAQTAIDEIKSREATPDANDKQEADADITITETMKDISLEIEKNKNNNNNKNKNKHEQNESDDEEDEDVEMKAAPEHEPEASPEPEQEPELKENKVFIPTTLENIMNPEHIIRRQKYTQETFQRRKDVVFKYKKKLQQEVMKKTKLGQEVMYEMDGDKLPKYHLQSINEDWDCGLPRIRDIIKVFLSRNWNKWDHNVSQKSFVIGDIIDPENPAKKYGSDQGVHEHKAYGLFAVKPIPKDTLLFEYAGCVKPIGAASKKLDHLETELDQTTLFDLIGHLDPKNRNKLHWGNKPNEQLVIDPSKWHNEGVYMNDFRTNVMTDPDDDVEKTENDGENDNDEQTDGDKSGDTEDQNDDMKVHGRKQNVKFYEVLVNGWPRVFAVAICDIKPNEELLGDYGGDFWANFRLMMRRQSQLNEIKARLNNDWQIKLDAKDNEIQQLRDEIKQLKQRK